MESASDLLHPKSVGALLAEEWSIDPLSVLPSFIEMMLIEDASKSWRSALGSVVDLLIQKMSHYGETGRPRRSRNESNVVGRLVDSIQRSSSDAARRLADVLRRYSPELRCLVVYLLERHCLRISSCTVAESIYGTKRVVLAGDAAAKRPRSRKLASLNSNHATRLALLLAFGPYTRGKLDDLFQRYQRTSTLLLQQSPVRRAFLRLYPIIIKAFDGGNLLCQWRFLLGRSVHFDLKSYSLGQIVRRVTLQDEQLSENLKGGDESSSSQAPGLMARKSSIPDPNQVDSKLQKSILYLLSASVAFSWLTQIRASWQDYRHTLELRQQQQAEESPLLSPSSSNAQPETSARVRLPGSQALPPPPQQLGASTRLLSDLDKSLCPLCRRERVEPIASTSGYVFCLNCLLPFVKQHGQCPVTGMDCPESRLVRLYEPRHNERM